MAAIKAKNVLKLGDAKRRRIWIELRSEPALDTRVKVGDFLPVPLIGRWSVGVRGIVEFLIGDDPESGLSPSI